MYDKDLFSADEFMGEITLNLNEFADGKLHEKWFTLQNEPQKKKKTVTPGEIHVKVQFTGPPGSAPPANQAAVSSKAEDKKAEPTKKPEAPKSNKPATVEE